MYKYKHETLMKVVLIVAGIIATVTEFLNLYRIENIMLWIRSFGYFSIIIHICGFIIGCFTILLAIRPNRPIPLNWLSLLVITVLLFLFATILGSIIVGIILIYSFFDSKISLEEFY